MINAYCKDDITLIKVTRGTWGNSSAETNVTMKGRIEFRTKLVKNQAGELVQSTAKVYLPTLAVTHNDRISYNSKEYSILNIEIVKDFQSRFAKLDLV